MKIGFVTLDTQYGQIASLLTHELNSKKFDDDDIMVFSEEKSFIVQPVQFPVFSVYYTRHLLDGCLVATSLSQAEYIKDIPTLTKKVYYVQDLDWLNHSLNFEYVHDIYSNIILFTRSEEHRKEVKRFCGKDSTVVKNFDLTHMITELKKL